MSPGIRGKGASASLVHSESGLIDAYAFKDIVKQPLNVYSGYVQPLFPGNAEDIGHNPLAPECFFINNLEVAL